MLSGTFTRIREHERLVMVCVSTVLVMAGQGVVSPVLPLFARSLGVSAAAVGLTLGVFGFARMVLNVPLGILSDRYGRRLLLVSGPLVTAAGMAGSGMAGGIADLLAWRLLAGAGSAMYMTGAQLYLVDISTPRNRARFIGTNQAALLTGVAVGPAIGGLVAERYGLRMPFFVVGASAVVATVYAWLRLPETVHRRDSTVAEEDTPRPRREWLAFALSRDFVAVAAVTMAIFSIRTGARGTLMPLLAVSRFDMTPASLGGVFTVAAVVGLVLVPPAGWATDRFGRKRTIVPSGFVSAAGILVMAAAPSPAALLAGIVVTAIGTGIAGPAPAAYAGDIAPPHLRGMAMGLYRSAGDVGFVVGPPLLGALADATSIAWAMAANAIVVALASALFVVLARETSHRLTAETPEATATTATG